MNSKQKMEKAFKELILKEPFYGLFALGLTKTLSDKVPTMGVRICNGAHELMINPEFLDKLSLNDAVAVFKHELNWAPYTVMYK